MKKTGHEMSFIFGICFGTNLSKQPNNKVNACVFPVKIIIVFYIRCDRISICVHTLTREKRYL